MCERDRENKKIGDYKIFTFFENAKLKFSS